MFSFWSESCGEIARGEVSVSSKDRSDSCRNAGGSLFQRGRTAMAIKRSAHFNRLGTVPFVIGPSKFPTARKGVVC